VTDHSSALAPPAWSPVRPLFHAPRQAAPQKRSCSRRGVYSVPHSSQVRVSLTASCYAGNLHGGPSQAEILPVPIRVLAAVALAWLQTGRERTLARLISATRWLLPGPDRRAPRAHPTVAWHRKRLDICPPLGIPTTPLPRSFPLVPPGWPTGPYWLRWSLFAFGSTTPTGPARVLRLACRHPHPRRYTQSVLPSVKELRSVFILTSAKIHLLFIFGLAWPDDRHRPDGRRGRCHPAAQR
jgi:hypothetical protein